MRTLRASALTLGTLAAGLGSVALGAGIAPSSQTRSVAATASIDFGELGSDFITQSDFAPGFSTFNSTVSADPNGNLNWPGISATASQLSEIMTNTISGDGTASAGADPGGAVSGVAADGSSSMSVTFTIAGNAPYTLDGLIDAASSGSTGVGAASVTLTGPGGTIFTLDTTSGALVVADAGLLTPGTYTLAASALAEMTFGEDSGDASFSVLFTIPEPTTLAALVGGVCLLLWRRR